MLFTVPVFFAVLYKPFIWKNRTSKLDRMNLYAKKSWTSSTAEEKSRRKSLDMCFEGRLEVKFMLHQLNFHTLQIELPAYFKVDCPPSRWNFQCVWDKLPTRSKWASDSVENEPLVYISPYNSHDNVQFTQYNITSPPQAYKSELYKAIFSFFNIY